MSTTQAFSRADTPANTSAPRYRTIPVVNGPNAICDEEDFAFLSSFTWRAYGTPPTFYPTIRLSGTSFHMHQLVVREEKKFKVNHRDGNPFNNCRANLRLASNQQIAAQIPKSFKRPSSSRYKGVYWCKLKLKWKASISIDGVRQIVGYFCDEEAAARAYDTAASAAFGDFAYLNFAPSSAIAPPAPTQALPNNERACAVVETLSRTSGPQTISLADGSFALCDPQDLILISGFKWYSQRIGSIYYPVTHLCGHTILMHHLALRSTGQRKVRHRDGNILNNCRENLLTPDWSNRFAMTSLKPKSFKPTANSRYKGVWKRLVGKRWMATIFVRGCARLLGSFTSEEEAARAYDKAARKVYGQFAHLNFPDEQTEVNS